MNTLAGFKGLRRDLLVALRKEQPLTAKELGVRFGLTANALRRHLKALEDSGLARFRREVRGVGGPVYAYSLTERGEQLFPREYAGALADALEVVRAEQGTEGVVRLFRRRWEALAEEARPALDALSLAERAHSLAAMLTANGYMAESESHAPGHARIREHNCAVREIAQRFPEVCSAEAAFIEQVLGAVVERQQHMMSGCTSCEYTATQALPERVPVAIVKRITRAEPKEPSVARTGAKRA
jgi:DeoR family suf operon transcriptional repressor